MTQEEKAKAYDEVRKKIAIRFGSNVADDFFAEFEESEDEKVRKEIVNYFQCQSEEEPTRKEIHNKWIAWLENIPYTIDHEKREGFHLGYKACLEKQGEKHPDPYNGISFEYNGHIWGMCARDGGVEILMDGNITSRVFPDKNNIIEQKPTDSYCQENCKGFQETGKCFADGSCKAKREAEQKPVIKLKTAEESLGIDSDTYNKIIDECIYGDDKVEPKFKVGDKIYLKPEYRMPDDDTPIANTVKEIRRIYDKHYRFDGSYIFIEDQDKYELVEQKAEENKGNIGGISPNWSEEDEQHIDSLLKRLDALCRNKFERTRFAISEDRDWLKSLRPQNIWKPSEGDIIILEKVIKGELEPKIFQATLYGILEQLKKLKEEKV